MADQPIQEFMRSAHAAEDIHTGGRWGALNDGITQRAINTPAGSEWHIKVLSAVCFQVFSEYLLLKSAHSEQQPRDVPLLAWRARNLLELSIWATYVTTSNENARRLYEDAGRDTVDTVNAFATWSGTKSPLDWKLRFQGEMRELERRAANEGIETLGGTYKRVSSAAEECGLKDHFWFYNKLLSKFAHPTAMQIMNASSDYALQRAYFLNLGCLFFIEGVTAMEKALLDR